MALEDRRSDPVGVPAPENKHVPLKRGYLTIGNTEIHLNQPVIFRGTCQFSGGHIYRCVRIYIYYIYTYIYIYLLLR